MGLFTKKSVTIEAVRWTGAELEGGAPSWMGQALAKDPGQSGCVIRVNDTVHVFTTEGTMIASPGDWIIQGVEGELYPCKDSVFQATYTPARTINPSPMSFGDALAALKDGARIFRAGWNGNQPGGFIPPSRAPIVYDGLCYILLASGQVAFCDVEDFDLVSKQQNWTSMKGYPAFTDYSEPGHPRTLKIHQLFFPDWPMADHENGDRLDNRRQNLRECTSAQNAQNSASRAGSSSQFKGVTWDRSRDKWMAAIQTGGKARTLGRFDDEAEAARAYDLAAHAAYGRFARLNFPSQEPRMWLSLSGPLHGRAIGAEAFWSPNNAAYARHLGGVVTVLPCITMKTATGEILMGWLASQTDMLADDWMVVA